MTTLVAKFSYPGIRGVKSARYTLANGISPGAIQVLCDPVFDNIVPTGDCIFGDGIREVRIPNCQIADGDVSQSLSGKVATVNLLDRRWQWKFGSITGHYNEPTPRVYDNAPINENGIQTGNPTTPDTANTEPSIQERNRKNPQQLAELCLKAMGETGYDISRIPTDDYPEVNWVAAKPAAELENICNRYGLTVVYNPFTDSVGIARQGEGRDMPDVPGMTASDNFGVDPPEPPRKITIFGAPVKYQLRFTLEAVGIDFDGRVKPLDELSYRPAGGWGKKKPPISFPKNFVFENPLPGSRTYRDAENLARNSVYRLYRITGTLPTVRNELEFWVPPINAEDFGKKKRRDQIILLDQSVETAIDDLGQRNLLPARVYGICQLGSPKHKPTVAGDAIKIPFSIVAQHQCIRFNDYVYRFLKVDGVRWVYPGDIILETACHVKDNVNNSIVRSIYEFPITAPREGARPEQDELAIVREDITKYHRMDYVSTTEHVQNTIETNETACREQAMKYAQAEAVQFITKTPQTRSWIGIVPVYTDGAIMSVAWQVGVGSEVLTTASRNKELPTVMPYPTRRKWEEISLENLRREKDQKVRQAAVINRINGAVDPFNAS